MKTDLFTKQRERKEAEQGFVSKEALRKEISSDVEQYLASGGTITVCKPELTKVELRIVRQAKKEKLSEKEIDRRLKEFAETGKVTNYD